MNIIKIIKNFITLIQNEIKTAGIFSVIFSLSFALIIIIIASICYLIEHIKNFIIGRGWTGLPL